MKAFDPTFKKRPLSHSQLSAWEYSPDQWYQRYILREPFRETVEMKFGKVVGKKLETDPTFLPSVPRLSKMEHSFRVAFSGVHLIGFVDSFDDVNFTSLLEYKTGKPEWTQSKADKHKQIDIYLLMNYITNKIKPENVECQLIWLPTRDMGDFTIGFVEPIEKNIKIFKTKRTMSDILNFGAYIQKTAKAMEEYVKNHD